MKTKITIVLVVLFSLQSFGQTVGQVFASGGINYRITSGTTVEVSPNLPADVVGAITIPAVVTESSVSYNVTSVGNYAFMSCNLITSLTLPCTLTTIETFAFSFCTALTSIEIPASVTFIGNYAFANCRGIAAVAVNWPTALSIDSTVFSNINLAQRKLYVPVGKETIYEAATVWTEFGQINAPITSIGSIIYVCGGETIATITPTGSGLNWYPDATTGVALPLSEQFYGGTLYVSRTSNCIESNRVPITVNSNSGIPAAPFTQNVVTGTRIAQLAASGVNLRWYLDPTGGTNLPEDTPVTTNSYYVSQTVDNCESARRRVMVNSVNGVVVTYCQNAPAVSLSASLPTTVGTPSNPLFPVGATLRFYTAATGGTAINAPTPSTRTIGRTIYYVTHEYKGIETNRIIYYVDILGIPAVPGNIFGVISQGALVDTPTTALYQVGSVSNTSRYNWTVPSGVNIVDGQGTNRLIVNFNNVSAGAGIIGDLTVMTVNNVGCGVDRTSRLTLIKSLPLAPARIRMTDAALAVPASGIATAVTNISRYIGQPTVLTLTANPVAGVTTYEWELPAGVTVLSGALPVRGGALGGNIITVNFEGVTTAGMFNYTTTAGILTHVLRIGVRSITGVGASVTSNAGLVNPTTSNTARLLTLTATAPRASSAIRMTDAMAVDPTRAITVISTFIGTPKTLTLTATPVATANEYSWELPAGVKQLSGGTSNVITVNFADVAAGTTSLYLGVKAVNGAGESVTSNTALVPTTNSTARLLRLSATVPGTVPAVTGQLAGLCGKNAYTYTISPSALATSYEITAPVGSIVTSKGTTSKASNVIKTSDLEFTVVYPEKFTTTKETPASISVIAVNGVGKSAIARTLGVTTTVPAPTDIAITRFPKNKAARLKGHLHIFTNKLRTKKAVSLYEAFWTVNDGVIIVSGQGTDEIEIDYSKVLPTIKSTKVSLYIKNSCGVLSLSLTRTIILEPIAAKTAETLTIEATEVYPNPVVNDFTIDVTASKAGNLDIAIYSLEGIQVADSKTFELKEGANTITQNVSNLAKGIYIVQLLNSSNNEVITKKLIKN